MPVRPLFGNNGFFGGGNAPAVAAPPRPMPASMRPPAPGMPDDRTLGDRLGWGDNPLHKALTNPAVSEMLMDLGYGLMNGTNFGQALQIAGNRTLQMEPMRQDERNEAEMRKRYSELISDWGPEYSDLASGIADGAFDPAEGFIKALEFKRSSQQEAEELERSRANALFLSDPQLRQMVEAGALPFAEAYEYQRQGIGGGDLNISTQPQWFTDPETGETVMGQVADNGTVIRTDTGGLQPLAPFDINQQRAAGTVSGRTQGEAAGALPQAAADAQRIALQIEDLKTHPGLDEIFGKTLGIIPNQWGPTVPGTNKANAMARIQQMSGNAFLSGRQVLKGGGAITDFESRKAEAAFARLSTAQSKEEFLSALDEFQQALDAGVAKLQGQAGSAAPAGYGQQAPVAINPATGERVMFNGQAWVPAS